MEIVFEENTSPHMFPFTNKHISCSKFLHFRIIYKLQLGTFRTLQLFAENLTFFVCIRRVRGSDLAEYHLFILLLFDKLWVFAHLPRVLSTLKCDREDKNCKVFVYCPLGALQKYFRMYYKSLYIFCRKGFMPLIE